MNVPNHQQGLWNIFQQSLRGWCKTAQKIVDLYGDDHHLTKSGKPTWKLKKSTGLSRKTATTFYWKTSSELQTERILITNNMAFPINWPFRSVSTRKKPTPDRGATALPIGGKISGIGFKITWIWRRRWGLQVMLSDSHLGPDPLAFLATLSRLEIPISKPRDLLRCHWPVKSARVGIGSAYCRPE